MKEYGGTVRSASIAYSKANTEQAHLATNEVHDLALFSVPHDAVAPSPWTSAISPLPHRTRTVGRRHEP